MSTHFTGRWELDIEKSSSQKNLLKAMGKPAWQRKVVDGANELYNIFQFKRTTKTGKSVYFYDISSKIFLVSKILKFIPFSSVKYSHTIVANKKEIKHLNDEKKFGDCTSRTEQLTGQSHPTFVVRWYLQSGILKVSHIFISDKKDPMKDVFRTDIVFTNKSGESVSSFKIFKRLKLRPKDLKYISKSKYYKYVQGLKDYI
jgi:hypothetical protein